jgi:LuxR family maltose regulon positive regulatory protein
LDIPYPKNETIPRTGLIAKMKKISAKKNIFMYAPAGYGKTVAARQWLNAMGGGIPAVFTATGSDNDPLLFYPRLARELSKLTAGVPALASGICDADTFLGALTALPAKSARRKYVLLDDMHLVTNKDILNILRVIALRMPKYIRVCFAGRTAPSQALTQTGMFGVITQNDLLFTEEETEILGAAKDIRLEAGEIREMLKVTGGWAIYLSALISDEERSGEPQSLTRYLKTRVWDLWSGETKVTLLKLSAASEITPKLCERLTGCGDGHKLLSDLSHRENAFLSLSGNDTYRFHDLFHEFLARQTRDYLDEEEIRRLNRTAAQWYFEKGFYYESAGYYIKNRDHNGINICMNEINRYIGRDVTLPVETLLDFTKRHIMNLPPDFIAENPYLISKCVGAALNGGDTEAFTSYLDMLYFKFPVIFREYPEHIETACLAAGTDYRVPVKVFIRRITRLTRMMNRAVTPGTGMKITSFTLNLPFHHRSMRDFSEYHSLEQEDFDKLKLAFKHILGNDYEAQETALRAGLLYEKGELFGALGEAFKSYGACRLASSPETVFSSYSILAQILFSAGARKEAEKLMTDLELYLKENARCLLANFRAMQTMRNIRAGSLNAARKWLDIYSSRAESLQFYQLCRHYATMRSYIALGEYAEAELFGERLQGLAESYARPLDQTESAVLTAIACGKSGKAEKAANLMKKALRTAAPYGFIQMFINEGNEVMPVILALRQSCGEEPKTKDLINKIVQNAVENFPAVYENTENPKLPRKRLKALELLGAGLSYSEIAEKMGLKRNTVKRHLSLAYEQLGVHDANEALTKAKALGIIN